MQLILRSIGNEFIKSLSFKKFELYQNFWNKFSDVKSPAHANLIIENEIINSCELAKLKLILEKHNIKLINIYSNNRETVLSGQSLKINSTFLNIKDLKNQLPLSPHIYKRTYFTKG